MRNDLPAVSCICLTYGRVALLEEAIESFLRQDYPGVKELVVLNDLDRFHLAMDVIDRVPKLQAIAAHQKQMLRNMLIEHKLYIAPHGDDMPEIRDWQWPA